MELHHECGRQNRPQSILTGSAPELLEQIITHVCLMFASLISLLINQVVVREGPRHNF